ncbi:gluconate kinase, SKI family [Blastococcus mobilis]|uniref:Gluconokinase n=2 Tax=Blastococcus mobilis TaxID=1938746 RepID=A0A238YQB4_9ACTN|nr:gluconate kinase, SKI family [Blastococcus mobilis]
MAPGMAAHDSPPTTSIVVMGVSGSGKSTVAAGLVERLGWEFAEGDDFHPPANVEKMRSGRPLDDDDRWPWLRILAAWIGEHERAGTPVVVTCSALKRSYRDLLRDGHPSVWFAHVTADAELLRKRVEQRTGHYMPSSLLESQLATLEPLQPDEPGASISGAGAPADVVAELLRALETDRGPGGRSPAATVLT